MEFLIRCLGIWTARLEMLRQRRLRQANGLHECNHLIFHASFQLSASWLLLASAFQHGLSSLFGDARWTGLFWGRAPRLSLVFGARRYRALI
jgi:hypothetical protein